MKQEHISDALTMLDDDIIEETDAVRDGRAAKRSIGRSGKNWWKWTAAAACVVLAAYVGIKVFPKSHDTIPEQGTSKMAELPLLTIGEASDVIAMGYEGYMAYDVSELVNANPWNETVNISTLPVYYNALTYDEQYIASGADFDKMREFLLEVAGRLGLDTDALMITDNAPDEIERQKILDKHADIGEELPEGYFDPTELIAKGDGVKVTVDDSMTALITFDPAIALPAQYNFTYHDSSYEDMTAVAEYLKTEYKSIIGVDNPQINICGGDYTIHSQRGFGIEFFDADGDVSEQIVNYNFNRTVFYCNDAGKLYMVRIFRPDLSGKAGDYPIITPETARELLLNGNYITTVPYEIRGEEYVKKVELVYRTGRYEKCYMPYYRFYVELPEEERENGLKDYGAYYVPAVEGAYISDMPVWNGRFN